VRQAAGAARVRQRGQEGDRAGNTARPARTRGRGAVLKGLAALPGRRVGGNGVGVAGALRAPPGARSASSLLVIL